MSKQIYGNGDEGIASLAISDTAAHVIFLNEVKRFDMAGVQLVTTGTLAGAWKVEVSNDWVAGASGGAPYGQAQNASPHWTDITSGFNPAIAAVTSGGSSQPAVMTLPFRAVRFSFTATSGSGTASILYTAKSWSS